MSGCRIEGKLEQIEWNEDGTVPVVVQEKEGEVLTLAYMDEEAVRKTIEEGYAHYYSRSKERIRMKGETSGNVQKVEEIRIDCDGDALLMLVDQKGPACHTGNKSCFYRELGSPEDSTGGIDYSLNILKELEEVIKERDKTRKEGSYTASLFESGETEIEKKLGEEAVEVIVAEDRSDRIYESADLLYHFLVLLRSDRISLSEVMEELSERRG
ncbi:MAG: bifunctional phosphoribosyl-AMP cyclohydrolase/phosphoribosyl-ATP diphosphatase HisIE [Thermoplasmata archaeon]